MHRQKCYIADVIDWMEMIRRLDNQLLTYCIQRTPTYISSPLPEVLQSPKSPPLLWLPVTSNSWYHLHLQYRSWLADKEEVPILSFDCDVISIWWGFTCLYCDTPPLCQLNFTMRSKKVSTILLRHRVEQEWIRYDARTYQVSSCEVAMKSPVQGSRFPSFRELSFCQMWVEIRSSIN